MTTTIFFVDGHGCEVKPVGRGYWGWSVNGQDPRRTFLDGVERSRQKAVETATEKAHLLTKWAANGYQPLRTVAGAKS